MPNRALVVGNDGANSLQGGSGAELIYGFNPAGPQGTVSAIDANRVAAGFNQPVFVTAAPGDPSRLFVVEKSGVIKILELGTGTVRATPFLNVSASINPAGEQGLLGLAFHPDFRTNGFFYVYASNLAGDSEIRRYSVSADPNVANAASVQSVLTIDMPNNATNHRAGWLGFGPDGFLYASVGDGGSTPSAAQDVNSLRGKILRLDVNNDAFPDTAHNYAIPAGNPFAGAGVNGADEIWALGLRNPWRPGFDRGLGDLFIADVGAGTWEEVNFGRIGALRVAHDRGPLQPGVVPGVHAADPCL